MASTGFETWCSTRIAPRFVCRRRPQVLAALRNLAIGIIRHATDRTINIAAATHQLARQPDTTLDLLGIPPLLCK
jgi:hypothetical protein